MNENKCCIKNCRNKSCMTVIDNPLCWDHWSIYCDGRYKNIEELKQKLKEMMKNE